MSETAATEKLNITETTYTLLPETFLGEFKGRRLSYVMLLLVSLIYTKIKAFSTKTVKVTYEEFMARFQISRPAVWNALSELRRLGVLKSKGKSLHSIACEYEREPYLYIDDYLHTEHFVVNGKLVKMPNSAKFAFELLNRHDRNSKARDKFSSSPLRIGKALKRPASTMCEALSWLDKAGVTSSDKAKNGHELTKYEVTKEYLRITRKTSKRALEDVTALTPKQEQERRQERNRALLMQEPEFKRLYEEREEVFNKYIASLFLKFNTELFESELERLETLIYEYIRKRHLKRSNLPPETFKTEKYKNAI